MYESKTTIVGNVGRTPEMRYTPAGVAVCDFSVAVNKSYVKDGETQERTKWFKIVCWRKLAEVTAQYLAKGRLVAVEGEVTAEAYIDKNGEARPVLVLTATTVKFLGKSNGSASGDDFASEAGADAFGSGSGADDMEIPF